MTDSAGVILLLTKGVLARPFCQLEVRKALELKRPLLLVHEADLRKPGFAEIYEIKAEAPASLQELFSTNESIA